MKHFLRFQRVCSKSFNYIITLRICRPGKPISSEPHSDSMMWPLCTQERLSLWFVFFQLKSSRAQLSPSRDENKSFRENVCVACIPSKGSYRAPKYIYARSMIFVVCSYTKCIEMCAMMTQMKELLKVSKVWDCLYLMATTFHFGGLLGCDTSITKN